MLNFFKNWRNKIKFDHICDSADLSLEYDSNKAAVLVLEDIFKQRVYADYFPFYQRATIVDIGGHYGYFSIFASRNCDPASTIYSLEPSPQNFKVLCQNLKDCKIVNVYPHAIALGEGVGDFELYEGESINHSLIKNYALSTNQRRTSTVKVLDLGTFLHSNDISTIDFLKMDCEGSEYDIILNASRDVMDKIMVISMEFHDLKDSNKTANRLREKLTADGFKIVKFQYQRTSMNLNYGFLIAIK